MRSGLPLSRLSFQRTARFAVMHGGSLEDAHGRSLSERLTEEPPPWLSPERTAWAAMVVPWLRACERCIRCAQAGGVLVWGDGAAAAGAASSPSTVPPVAPKPARAPAVKLDLADFVRPIRREHPLFEKAGSRAAGFRVRGIDHDALGLRPLTGEPREYAVEDAEPAPADEAVLERLVRTIAGGRVLPLKPVADHIDDTADHAPVVQLYRLSRGFPRDIRFQIY